MLHTEICKYIHLVSPRGILALKRPTLRRRKKVQDFYQRTSLTSYCTAFAYRPLTRAISDKMSDIYLELPADSKHLYTPHRSPTPLPWDFRNVLDPRVRGILGQFHSTGSFHRSLPSPLHFLSLYFDFLIVFTFCIDSLLCNENKDDDVSDVEGCFEVQCNQVFIGMVTMQYQAQTDMVRRRVDLQSTSRNVRISIVVLIRDVFVRKVQLIEQLDRACIRFVHFSKENELRSRVFSEKMGLESGWNCHISLLSEGARYRARKRNSMSFEVSSSLLDVFSNFSWGIFATCCL